MAETKQILLAHGDPLARIYGGSFERIGKGGYFAPQAHTADEALEAVATTEFGLIITDAGYIPGSGWKDEKTESAYASSNYGEIARRFVELVRKSRLNRKTPIAVVTLYPLYEGSTLTCSREGMLEAGVNEFFHMPRYEGNTDPVFEKLRKMHERNGK